MMYLKYFLKDEEGQDMVEYALLLGFIALVAVVGATALGTAVDNKFNSLKTQIS